MKKWMLRVLMCVALVGLFCLPTSASNVVASGYCGGEGDGTNLTWSLTEDGMLTINGKGEMADFHTIDGDTTWIMRPWDEWIDNLFFVIVEDGVTTISDYAFYMSPFLVDVVMSDSVLSIGAEAFYDCDSLTNITIGDGVLSIGEQAFLSCDSLTSVHYTGDIAGWCGTPFENWLDDPRLYASELYIDGAVVSGELIIPKGITSIADFAFFWCDELTSVTIPDSVTTIGESAFSGCDNLISTYYTGDIAGWCDISFENCDANPMNCARELYIGGVLVSGELVIPKRVAGIGNHVFYNCTSLTDVSIGDGVASIGEGAFNGCVSLTEVVIPGSVTSVGADAFYNCESLANVIIGDGVTSIGDFAFSDCNMLPSVTVPDSVTGIGRFAFSYCDKLTTVTVGNGVTKIGAYAFYDCTELSSVIIGESVTVIGERAFAGCSALTQVHYAGNVAGWCNILFESFSNPLRYADRLYIGGELVTELVIPDSVTSIGDDAFYDCDGLTTVYYAGDMAGWCSISFGNFGANPMNCAEKLYIGGELVSGELVIPKGVTSIANYAFYNCDSLTSVTIPDSVTAIGDGAFGNCSGFAGELTIPNSVLSIGERAFESCGFTGSLVVPNSVISIGRMAFAQCEFTGNLSIGAGVRNIGDSAFWHCHGFKGNLIIPDSVVSIGEQTFYFCDGFTGSLMIGENVGYIGSEAFWNCAGISDVYFLGDAPEVTRLSSFDIVPLHYNPNKSGWSTPTWNGYAAYPIVSAGSSESTPTHTDSYYGKTEKYGFGFRKEDGNSWLDQVTVSLGEQSFFSGDKSYLFAELAASDPMEMVTFQRSDYRDVQLPVCVLDESTNIVFYPQSQTDPFVQNVYARIDEKTEFGKVIRGGTLTLHAGNLQERVSFYIDVDWGNMGPGKLYLSQSTDPEDGIEVFEGMNEGLSISTYLDSSNAFYLIMEFADGSHMGQKLGISVLAQQLEQEIDLGENIDVPTPNIEALSSFKFGIELPKNFDISLSVKKDGTVKGVLGLKGLEAKEVDKCFDSIKDELADSQVKNEFGHFLKTFKNGGFQIPPKSSKFVVSADVQLLGYVEGKLIETENGKQDIQFTEGGIGVVVEGKVENTWQLYAFGAPFYAGLSISPSLEFTTAVCTENGVVQADPIDLKGEAKLKAKGGLGLDGMATVGIYGKGSIIFKHKSPGTKEDLKLYVNASFGAEAEFFAFSADLELLKLNDLYLYGSPDTRMLMMSAASVDDALANADWQPQSRDYLYAISPIALDGDSTQTGGETIVSMVYPYANMRHAVLPDGTQILVWTADPGTRQEDNNRTVLYYAYNDGSGWSYPAPVEVEDDGTADFNPVLQVLDDTAYLFWQDASRPLTADDDVTTTAAVMNISCAVFDAENGSFTGLGTVGSEYYDGAVSATVMDGKPAVVWVSNSTNSPLSASGKVSTLYRAVWDGEQWNTSVLAEELGAIDQTAANGESVWFSADTDYDGTTMNDREIFFYDGTLTQLTDNEVADTKPVYENDTLLWYSGGSVVTADEKTIPLAEDTDRYQYIISDNGMEAVTYVVTDENRVSALYASFNDGTGWGDPIQLTSGNGNIGSFSAQFLSDGTLSVAVRERSVTLPEDEYDVAQLSAAAQIKTYTVTPVCDLTVEGVDYLAHSLVSGGTLDVMLDVRNAGMTAVELMKVSVLDNGDVLHEGVYEVNLLSGQSDTLHVAVPLPEYIPESMTVQVSAIGYTDATAEDNSAELTLRLQDVSLESATATSDGASTQVTVLAVNRGQQDLDGVILSLTDEDGTALDSKIDLSLAAGESQFITFDLAQAYANNTLLKVTASGPETENIMANNSAAALVSATPEPKLTLTASYLRTETSLKVVTELDNTTDEGCSYGFYCALYNEDGQQLAVQSLTEQFTAGADNNMVQFTFDGDWSEVAAIKVFALKSGAEPLTGSAQVSVEH